MKHLTAAQTDILRRLSNGDEMTQNWDSGTCKWKTSNTFAPRQTVDSLHDRDYVECYFLHFSDTGIARHYVRITERGRAALGGAK